MPGRIFTLNKEHKLQEFWNKVPMKMFGAEDEVNKQFKPPSLSYLKSTFVMIPSSLAPTHHATISS
jgi:hypothetical protein